MWLKRDNVYCPISIVPRQGILPAPRMDLPGAPSAPIDVDGLGASVDAERGKFLFQGIKVFLTYPQVAAYLTCSEVMHRIKTSRKFDADRVVVAQENHTEGGIHFHIVICFKERVRTKRVDFFDDICDKHPNIRKIRSLLGCLKYVIKDGVYVEHGWNVKECIAALKKKTSTKACQVAEAIKKSSGSYSLADCHLEYPGFALRHQKEIESYARYWRREKARIAGFGWTNLPVPRHEPSRSFVQWLNENCDPGTRKFKQPQLYVVGPTGCGKTTAIRLLRKLLPMYEIPLEDWYGDYGDGLYGLSYLDEFKRHKTRQFLAKWLEGGQFKLKRRNREPLEKMDNLGTIIFSNYTLEELYGNDPKYYGVLPMLYCRLKVIVVQPGQYLLPESWLGGIPVPVMGVPGSVVETTDLATSSAPMPIQLNGDERMEHTHGLFVAPGAQEIRDIEELSAMLAQPVSPMTPSTPTGMGYFGMHSLGSSPEWL